MIIPHLVSSTRFPALALLFSRDCSIDANRFQCNLDSVLSFLYIAGAVLAVVLIVIAAIAFRIYLRNKKIRLAAHDSKSSHS